jgi:ribosomal protein S18 acetylase RimI-like enzyme
MKIRKATQEDAYALLQLYKRVADVEGGISRNTNEINEAFIQEILSKALSDGFIYVAENPFHNEVLIAEIHTYPTGIQSLKHTLGHLQIIVHPDFQGTGIGRRIFSTLLQEITTNHNHVARIELIVRESNARAVTFYKTLGFKEEGLFERRIISSTGELENDVPMAWFNPNFK